jgi:tripartite-type tricarboxylate transporter receptor subunit TctC
VLPPGTPKDRVEIVQEAMRKTFKDSEFNREYQKIVGEEASPLTPEELTKTIQDTPRDAELVELFKTFSGSAPLPTR